MAGQGVEEMESNAGPGLLSTYVIVGIDKRQFAIPAEKVREIVPMPSWVTVPQRPRNFRGVVNLRGRVIRLLDTRMFLGLKSAIDELNEMVEMMAARKQDHIRWLKELEASILEKRPFGLATDPTKCAFGKWYYAYKPSTRPVEIFLRRFEMPHREIHGVAHKALSFAEQGQFDQSYALIDETRGTVLNVMINLFDQSTEAFRDGQRELALVLEQSGEALALAIDSADTVESIGEAEISEMTADLSLEGPGRIRKVAKRAKSGDLVFILDVDDLFRSAQDRAV